MMEPFRIHYRSAPTFFSDLGWGTGNAILRAAELGALPVALLGPVSDMILIMYLLGLVGLSKA
jgi:hypothetical protein